MSDYYVAFPGTTGNYVSTDDVNLVSDADTAHVHQSIGQWLARGPGVTISLDSTVPIFGDNSVKVTMPGTISDATWGAVTADTTDVANTAIPVSPSTTYSGSIVVNGVSGDQVSITRFQYTSGISLIGTYGTEIGSATLTGGGDEVTFTLTTESTAAWLLIVVHGKTSSMVFNVGKTCVREGADTTFVPSLRIVGDVDLRSMAKVPLAINKNIGLALWETTSTKRCFMGSNSTKAITLYYSDDGTTTNVAISDVGTFDPSVFNEYRITLDIDNGVSGHDISYWVNDVSLGSDTVAGALTGGFPGGSQGEVGSIYDGTNFLVAGDIKWAEIRDGIDGPVVARFDADDVKAVL